jgi:hypothetical protein
MQKIQQPKQAGFTKLQPRTAGMALHSSNHVGTVNAGFAWR